jgi:hypothetical protein
MRDYVIRHEKLIVYTLVTSLSIDYNDKPLILNHDNKIKIGQSRQFD